MARPVGKPLWQYSALVRQSITRIGATDTTGATTMYRSSSENATTASIAGRADITAPSGMLRIRVTPPLAPFSATSNPSVEGTMARVASYVQWPSLAASDRRMAQASVVPETDVRTAIAKFRWKLHSTADTPDCPTLPSLTITPTRLLSGCPGTSTYSTSSKVCRSSSTKQCASGMSSCESGAANLSVQRPSPRQSNAVSHWRFDAAAP